MLWIGLQTHHGTAGLLPRSPAFTEYLALSPFIPSVTRFTRVGLLWMTTQWEGCVDGNSGGEGSELESSVQCWLRVFGWGASGFR
jgi:hypothetical protein